MTTLPVWISGSPVLEADGEVASRIRMSTSAGPAVGSRMSSKPQSRERAARPPSLATTSSGDSLPVVSISRQRARAFTRSRRASSRMTSHDGASSRAVASAATTCTRWGSSSRAGRISADRCMSLVNSNTMAIETTTSLAEGERPLVGHSADSAAGRLMCHRGDDSDLPYRR